MPIVIYHHVVQKVEKNDMIRMRRIVARVLECPTRDVRISAIKSYGSENPLLQVLCCPRDCSSQELADKLSLEIMGGCSIAIQYSDLGLA